MLLVRELKKGDAADVVGFKEEDSRDYDYKLFVISRETLAFKIFSFLVQVVHEENEG